MAVKVTETTKAEFQAELKEYKRAISKYEAKMKDMEKTISLTQDAGEVALMKLKLAEMCCNAMSRYSGMSRLSLHKMKIKNESYLNDARKLLFKALLHMEEAVGKHVNDPLNENDEIHEHLKDKIDINWKLNMVKSMGYNITVLKEYYGDNSKWKWSFVELEGRFAVVVKNLIHFKALITNLDPRVEGYKERMQLLKFVKSLLMASAKAFRQKYEIKDQRIDDMRYALSMVGVLGKIHNYIGEMSEGEEKKKVYDLWQKKMEADLKHNDKKK